MTVSSVPHRESLLHKAGRISIDFFKIFLNYRFYGLFFGISCSFGWLTKTLILFIAV